MASKNLGTLTIDVVAQVGGFVEGMDKSERASKQWRRNVEKELKKVGQAAIGAAATAAGGIAAITASTVRAAGEISRLSSLSGVGAEDFQRYAAGARFLGVEQDKLADIFKDTSDKFGDFLQTGGGPLADFFENIAPQVGVTAEEFKKLSGPQALELYVASLEKAKLSQNEMVFYMEAVASDATRLLPLLKNNATGFKDLGREAEDAGAILKDDTIQAAREMKAALFLMENAGTGLKNQIADELLPVFSDLAEGLTDISVQGHFADDAAALITNTFKGLSAWSVGTVAGIHLMGRALGGLAAIGDELTEGETWVERWIGKAMPIIRVPRAITNLKSNLAEIGDVTSIVGNDLDELAQSYGSVINMIMDLGEDGGSGGDREGRLKGIAEYLAAVRAEIAKTVESITKTGDGDGDDDNLLDGLTEQQQAYRDLVQALQTDEERLTEQMRERFAILDAMQGITSEERADVAGRIADSGFLDVPDIEGLSPEVGGAFAEISRLDDEEEELAEWYMQQLELLKQYRADRADLASEWDAKEEELFRQHQDRLMAIESARNEARLAAAESVSGDLASIVGAFAGEQSDAYRALFAISKGFSLAQSAVSIATGIARANELGFPANLAEMARVAATGASVTATIKGASFAGAYDAGGDIPAGMFGIVGEKGPEIVAGPASVTGRRDTLAVFDRMARDKAANDGDSGDVVINIINNAPGVKVTEERDAFNKRVRNIVIEEVSTKSSKTSQALMRNFKIPPKGNL